jgi:hypothetical protein
MIAHNKSESFLRSMAPMGNLRADRIDLYVNRILKAAFPNGCNGCTRIELLLYAAIYFVPAKIKQDHRAKQELSRSPSKRMND